jgi:hypothetical protein
VITYRICYSFLNPLYYYFPTGSVGSSYASSVLSSVGSVVTSDVSSVVSSVGSLVGPFESLTSEFY